MGKLVTNSDLLFEETYLVLVAYPFILIFSKFLYCDGQIECQTLFFFHRMYRQENEYQEVCERALLDLTETLGLEDPSLTSIYAAINKLDMDEFRLTQDIKELTDIESSLDRNVVELQLLEKHILAQEEATEITPNFDEQIKILNEKRSQYLDRLDSNLPNNSKSTLRLNDLISLKSQMIKLLDELEVKNNQLAVYETLPPDLTLAQLKLIELQEQVRLKMETRSKLF
ncbi:hypothetical protein BC833DRAFT_86255 [Globomyces pollinis-pini]|nr:hypothetical protein BC833DRAFT_86255 [Globomyces pollinis-pini]